LYTEQFITEAVVFISVLWLDKCHPPCRWSCRKEIQNCRCGTKANPLLMKTGIIQSMG